MPTESGSPSRTPGRASPRRIILSARLYCAWIISLTVCGAALAAPADTTPPASSYSRSRENLEAQQWFRDAKLGVFLHWGLYSELGGAGDAGTAEWIMERKQIPIRHYERLAQFFNPTAFDAEEWVRQIKAAGARYVTITSKHHDGFAMYASKVSSYNVRDATPFRRDPIAELAAACRKAGIKLFFYYSQLDWHHPDYFPRGRTSGSWTGRPDSGDWDRYIAYEQAQLQELLTQYGPIGGIWFDGWWDQKSTVMQDRWRLSETYQLIHSLQPAALIINNHHRAPFPGEDVQTFEQDLPGQNRSGLSPNAAISELPLETAETMNGSWGFNLIDDHFKSTQTLIRTLVGAAGRDANLLLNTGPMPNGKLQPENVQTLAEIGAWLGRYGESIYGTRGGPITPRPWGVTTHTNERIYVHVLDWQEDTLLVPLKARVRSAQWLRDGKAVDFKQTTAGVELKLRPGEADEWDRIIRLELIPP